MVKFTLKKPDQVLRIQSKDWQPPIVRSVVLMKITPALAKRMLEYNTNNRTLKASRVKVLEKELRSGNWVFTHQGIAFSKDKVLLDGQHRLQSIVNTGIAVDTPVTFGLDPEVFSKIDIPGGQRKTDDLLGIVRPDSKSRTKVCAIARSMLMGLGNGKPSRELIVEVADWYYDLIVAVIEVTRKQTSWAIPAPFLAAFANAARGNDEWSGGHGGHELDNVLYHAMRYGEQEWEGPKDPMKVLYQRISRMKSSSGELLRHELYAYATQAMRYALDNKPATKATQAQHDWGENGELRATKKAPFTGKSVAEAKQGRRVVGRLTVARAD